MGRTLFCLLATGVTLWAAAACENADAGLVPGGDPEGRDPPDGHAFVIFGADTVTARLADTGPMRAQGLMGVTDLPDGEGMLFIFERLERVSFWMRDTPIDLDIAFLNPDFEVVGIQQMTAESDSLHTAPEPVRHALEVRRGWFAAKGIAVGAQAEVVFGMP